MPRRHPEPQQVPVPAPARWDPLEEGLTYMVVLPNGGIMTGPQCWAPAPSTGDASSTETDALIHAAIHYR